MVNLLTSYLHRTTMYQLVVRYLTGLLLIAIALAMFGKINFSWLEIVQTTALSLLLCFVANRASALIWRTTTNKESWLISGLILALVIGPGSVAGLLIPLLVAAIAAMGSKFVLRWRNHHIFNPAVVGLTAMTLLTTTGSSWWVGSSPLSYITILGGIAVCYKIRRLKTAGFFLAVYLAGFFALNLTQLDFTTNIAMLNTLLFESPLVFLATIMLVEPATSPNSQRSGFIYAAFVALAIVAMQSYVPSLTLSFELALLAGNLLTRMVEPRNNFQMTLVRREMLAPSIESFFFESVPTVSFTPGQFLEWTIPHSQPDSRGTRRWFTIASAPTEKRIQLTTRFAEKSSSFKTALRQLKIGEQIWAHGLEGDFVLPTDKKVGLVFIAGGIGITPFRSMVRFLLDSNEARDITLIYAVKNQEDLIGLEVFEEATKAFGLKLITVVSSPAKDWSGHTGNISAELLRSEVPELTTAQVYISGPEPMVESLSQTLRDLKVPNHAIHQDFFPGYLAEDVTSSKSTEQ